MFPEPRPCREASDLERICTLLGEGRAAGSATYYVHPGDLVWWLFYPDQSAELGERIFLWESGPDLLGWVLLTPEERALDVFVHPRLRGSLEAEAMFTWGEARLAEQLRALSAGELRVHWICLDDAWRVPFLQARGYTQRSTDVCFSCALDRPLPEPALPPGFQVQPVRGEADAERRARASHAAFESPRTFEAYLPRYQSFMRSRGYARAHDRMLLAPDGRCAAFCIYWLDPISRSGHFEPVGTHPDFQRRGLGRALLQACLREMQVQGMRSATVCTLERLQPAVGLYASAGFQVTRRLGAFLKEI